MLIVTGWWPPGIEFDIDDLQTVAKVVDEQRRRRR